MEKLTFDWTLKDLTARNFLIAFNKEPVGQLSFNDMWTFNASYETGSSAIRFVETGFFRQRVSVKSQQREIGKLDLNVFGTTTLQLEGGKIFTLTTNFFGRNMKWKNDQGDIVVELNQPTLRDLGRGTILTDAKLDKEVTDLLSASGLYISNLTSKRIARFIPILLILLGGLRLS